MGRELRERPWLGVICAAVGALVPWAPGWQTGPLATLERFSLDARMRALTPPGFPAADIMIVPRDDQSLDLLEPKLWAWPWRRDVHAEVIDSLTRAGAKVAVFDLLFSRS